MGPARLTGGGETNPTTAANRGNRARHARSLEGSALAWSNAWKTRQEDRAANDFPPIEDGIPLLLKIDPSLDIDELRKRFDFEIVAEQDDGFVIVASADISLAKFREVVRDFSNDVRGSGTVAGVHELQRDPEQQDRIARILSENLLALWGTIADHDLYIVDFGIACAGDWQIPTKPKRGRRTDSVWAKTEADWANERESAYIKWDELRDSRVADADRILSAYGAEIMQNIDGGQFDAPTLPDSFTLRVRLNGRALKDFVLNYPYLFEVAEPDTIETPQGQRRSEEQEAVALGLTPPPEGSPAVCVIDTGIQEGHVWLAPAVDTPTSKCFLPDRPATEIADELRPNGHGTRVAGAVLHGELDLTSISTEANVWIQNARVLDENGRMLDRMLPASVLRDVVLHFHSGPRRTRIFNQSINGTTPCRMKHMSSWAAEIDILSNELDILVIQSAGNILLSGAAPNIGLTEILRNGQTYPGYFELPVCRISNPAQSLQALTVGSVAYGVFEDPDWRSIASQAENSSGFSRVGFGIWGAIKPEVVEFGGDQLASTTTPINVSTPPAAEACYPRLTRSTLYGGPSIARDGVGTSFATPKVSKIAAEIARALPDESALTYRALIVQSAKWPGWAEELAPDEKSALIKRIGYGLPNIDRASKNNDFRTTFLSGIRSVRAGECHVFQVRIPDSLRRPADEFDIRIDVTLSYMAMPRRTRRTHRGYLATWADWISSRIGESQAAFMTRALRSEAPPNGEGTRFRWNIEAQSAWGEIPSVRRGVGTLQKDWAFLKSNSLPEEFCIAIRGHRGWSNDPDSAASYSLAVTFEALGEEIQIYEPLRVAVNELQAEIEIEQLEIEVDEL
jgi:hypothetical protein